MQREAASQPSLPWQQAPAQAAGHSQSAPPREGGHGRPGQRDASHGQGGPRDGSHGQAGPRDGGHGQGGPREAGYGAQPEGDMPTRRVRPEGLDYGRNNPVQPPPYIPAQGQFQPDLRTKREPFIPGAIPGQALQRSAAYGVASAMLLVIMIVLASFAPVVVAVLAIPVAVLLRAADLAQPELRATGAAALDVIRVFAFPKALAKSVGITLALFLYALILGLPVTLLLAVVARDEPVQRAGMGERGGTVDRLRGPGSRRARPTDAQDAVVPRTLENSGDGDGGSSRGRSRALADPRGQHVRGQHEEVHMGSGGRRAGGRAAQQSEGELGG